jgi:hypothetical protein
MQAESYGSGIRILLPLCIKLAWQDSVPHGETVSKLWPRAGEQGRQIGVNSDEEVNMGHRDDVGEIVDVVLLIPKLSNNTVRMNAVPLARRQDQIWS